MGMIKDWQSLTLHAGSHAPNSEMCLIEAVTWFADEPWSDHPQCVSPVLAAFGMHWNDDMRSNEEREQLKQYIPLLVGTIAPDLETFRSWMALDWMCRVYTPAWLDLAGLKEHARQLRASDAFTGGSRVKKITPQLRAAGHAVGFPIEDAVEFAVEDADGNAVWAAGGAAAGAAARAAAGAAAGAAARFAAWDASWDDARVAAWDAAWNAAWTAATAAAVAGSALEPTVRELQESAHGLFRSMIALSGTKGRLLC